MIQEQPSPRVNEETMASKTLNPQGSAPVSPEAAMQMKSFYRALAVLSVIFAYPLYKLFEYSLSSDMYSYMILIPVVTWYLIRLQKPWTHATSKPDRGPGYVLLALSLLCVVAALTVDRWHPGLELDAKLDLPIAGYLLAFAGIAFICLGRELLSVCKFPLWMMVFLLPIPIFVMDHIVVFLQIGSAALAGMFFDMSGTPVFQEGLGFRFASGGSITVAPECSGIHSSYILLITSLLAGHLFLKSPWRKTILAVAVLPLALVRNGFRVFTIGELCAHYGMQMIDSPIHRKGGPIFFVMSLVPFFLLLVWLRRGEQSKMTAKE